MKKYQSYKSSGIEWIGEIPEHWGISKVKYTTEIFGRIGYRGYTIEDIVNEDEGVITISPSNIKNDKFTIEGTNTYLSFEKYHQSPEIMIFTNDIILVKTGSTIGKTSIIPEYVPKMTINPQLVVLKNIKMNNRYFYYQTVCDYFKLSFLVEQTGSSTPTISQEKINEFPILKPTSTEQIQIVRFLDEKTELIDKLISTKERKIDLLKQQRISLINEIVTKGLDPKVKMKNSGVEWIGEIPEHWEMKRVSNFGIFFKGNGIKKDEVKDEGLPCIRYGEIYTKYDRVVYQPLSFIDEETSKNSVSIKKGDILFTGSGETIEDIGKSILYYGENDIFVGGDIIVLRLNGDLNPLFISYLMNTSFVQYQKSLSGRGEIIVHIYSKNIKEIKTPLPPPNEQLQIIEYLDTRIKEIDDLVSMEERKIILLKEYRQSLISEVITGKIDVRTNLN